MFQNGPTRKVIMIKVISEDFLIFFPSCRSSWVDIFSEDFLKKHDGPFIEIGVSDRLDIAYSERFWPFKLILINSSPVD